MSEIYDSLIASIERERLLKIEVESLAKTVLLPASHREAELQNQVNNLLALNAELVKALRIANHAAGFVSEESNG